MKFSMVFVALVASSFAIPIAQESVVAGAPATEVDETNTGNAAFQRKAFDGNQGQGNPGQGNPGQGNQGQGNQAQGNQAQVTPDLIPDFGVTPNTNPDGTGNCDGINGKKIPCFCPPSKQAFAQKLQEFVSQGNVFGAPISFPPGNDAASQKARLQASVIALQSFNGTKGVGCPVVATTFQQQIAQLG